MSPPPAALPNDDCVTCGCKCWERLLLKPVEWPKPPLNRDEVTPTIWLK